MIKIIKLYMKKEGKGFIREYEGDELILEEEYFNVKEEKKRV